MEVKIKNSTAVAISLVIIAALIGATGFLLAQMYLPKTGYVVSAGQVAVPTGVDQSNIFEGKITSPKVSPGKLEGVTTYDANCVGNEITQCDSGIMTVEYGVLNFHYSHKMEIQPCLHMFGPEKVIVDILDSDGNAKITRTIDVSMMGHHE